MQSVRRQRISVRPISGIRDSIAVSPVERIASDGPSFADVLKETMLASQSMSERNAQQTAQEGTCATKAGGAEGESAPPGAEPKLGEAIVKGWSPFDSDSTMDLHDQLDSLLSKKSVLIGVA
jgi:hypothetical protein